MKLYMRINTKLDVLYLGFLPHLPHPALENEQMHDKKGDNLNFKYKEK